MSYILDALRRADAERQRGGVPGLNTPGAAPLASDPAATQARRPLWLALGAAGAAALVALGMLALRGWRPDEAPRAGALPATLPAPPVVPAPAAPPPVVVTAAPAAPPVVVVMPAPLPALLPASAPAVAVPGGPSPGMLPAPAEARAAAAAPARVPTLAELPEALRRQMPALALGGSMYSEQAAQRLVIVNGQVAREGDEAAPGVRVLQIRPKTVVFGVGGQRFEAPL